MRPRVVLRKQGVGRKKGSACTPPKRFSIERICRIGSFIEVSADYADYTDYKIKLWNLRNLCNLCLNGRAVD